MQLKKWYKLKEECKAEFIDSAKTINSRIVEFINDRPFMVFEYEYPSSMDTGGIEFISFDGVKGIHRIDAIPGFNQGYGNCWFYQYETDCFEEVGSPFLEMIADEPVDDYSVMTTDGCAYLIRRKGLTLEGAEEFAEKWLQSEPEDDVIVFKGGYRFKAKLVPQIEKTKY